MPTTVLPRPQRSSTRERPLVLLVEDNITQLDLYAMVLEEAVDVLAITRGETALVAAREHLPDAIVVDVLLPDLDGLTLAARLRTNELTSGIPIIVLTGDDGAYARASQMRSELTELLMKPCPADRLLAVLRRALPQTSEAR